MNQMSQLRLLDSPERREHSYGIFLAEGKGVVADWREAAKYFKHASDEGNRDG